MTSFLTTAQRKAMNMAEPLGPGVLKCTEEAIVLKRSELERVKGLVQSRGGRGQGTMRSGTRLNNGDGDQHSQHSSRSEVAQRRRERMRAVDEARRAREDAEGTNEIAQEKIAEGSALMSRAQLLLDEQEDEVKTMNSLMLYSQCATIRDAQQREKELIAREKKKQEEAYDRLMEMERLKAIQMYEDREKKRAEDAQRGANVIRKQIVERERARQLEAEKRERESQAMLKHIEKMRETDRREAEERRQAARKLREDIESANIEQIRCKIQEKEMEVEENRRIAKYMMEKDEREAALAAEKARIAKEKELEVARLRALQEKVMDRQSELDELRARRHQEEEERRWRARERAEAEKRRQTMLEMQAMREKQKLDREMRLAQTAKAERDEFERVLTVQQEQDRLQREADEINERRKNLFATELKDQMDQEHEAKVRERLAFLEEGRILAKEKAKRDAHIEEIRRRKLEEMQRMGVPKKYCVEMANKKLVR